MADPDEFEAVGERVEADYPELAVSGPATLVFGRVLRRLGDPWLDDLERLEVVLREEAERYREEQGLEALFRLPSRRSWWRRVLRRG